MYLGCLASPVFLCCALSLDFQTIYVGYAIPVQQDWVHVGVSSHWLLVWRPAPRPFSVTVTEYRVSWSTEVLDMRYDPFRTTLMWHFWAIEGMPGSLGISALMCDIEHAVTIGRSASACRHISLVLPGTRLPLYVSHFMTHPLFHYPSKHPDFSTSHIYPRMHLHAWFASSSILYRAMHLATAYFLNVFILPSLYERQIKRWLPVPRLSARRGRCLTWQYPCMAM
jgi:hypothetical protein